MRLLSLCRAMEIRFMRGFRREYLYVVFIILIIIGIFQYGIQKICGFTMYPDEFGYWASAAEAVGYDWREVASLGSYYSFGYSVILAPLLMLFEGGIAAYRAAVTVNMVLMCLSAVLLMDVTGRLFPEIVGELRVLVSGIAVLYPAWIFYMQMTLAEAFLMFLFVGIFCLFVSFMQKPGVIRGTALALMIMFIYCVHMRTVSVAIACLVTLALWGLAHPALRKQIFVLAGVVAVAGLAVIVVKRNVVLSVFSGAESEALAVNDYASQIWKIRQILTPTGIWILCKEIIAKIFYLGIAGFGIFYWAVGWCVGRILDLLHRKFEGEKFAVSSEKPIDFCAVRQWTALFLLLTVVGEVLICSVYMHGSEKIDCLIYGRYNEFLMPVLIAVGVPAMLKGKGLLWKTLLAGGLTGLMVFPVLSVIRSEGMEGIRGYFVVGLSGLIDEEAFEPEVFFRNAWVFGCVLMSLTAGVVGLVKDGMDRRPHKLSLRGKNGAWILGSLIMMEVITGMQASTHYTYKVNRIGFENLKIAEKILEESDGDRSVVYLDEGVPEFIDFQQMQMPDISIRVIEGAVEDQKENLGDFLIAVVDTGQREILEQIYDRYIKTSTFILYYHHRGDERDEKDKDSGIICVNDLFSGSD